MIDTILFIAGLIVSLFFLKLARERSRFDAKHGPSTIKKHRGATIVSRNVADEFWYEVTYSDGTTMQGQNRYCNDTDQSFDSIKDAEQEIDKRLYPDEYYGRDGWHF